MANSLIVGEATAVGGDRQSKPRVAGKTPQQKVMVLIKKAQAIRASVTMIYVPIGIWFIQFFFWALGMVSYGIENVPVLKAIYPGDTLFAYSYLIIAILGILTLIYVAVGYSIQRVNWYGGIKFIALAPIVALYLYPVINLMPWFMVWMCIVVYNQNED